MSRLPVRYSMVALTSLWMEYGSKQTHQIGFSGKKKYGKPLCVADKAPCVCLWVTAPSIAPTISTRKTKNTIINTMGNKRGSYKPRRSDKAGAEDNQMIYMRGLSTQVRKACDEWLDKRGLKAKSWMQQKEEGVKKKKKP